MRQILIVPVSKMPAYLFPFFILTIEWIFRHTANVDSQEFLGPSLAVAGLTLLVPLIVPKRRELPDDIVQAIRDRGYDPGTVTTKGDITFIFGAILAIGLLIVFWLGSLYFAIKAPTSQHLWLFSDSLWAGLISYLIGVVGSQVKEVV